MIVKMFELRDVATFIPVMCVKMESDDLAQRWLLQRAGYHGTTCYLLVDPRGHGRAEYDPYDWNSRTFGVAHDYINKHFEEMKDGDVIDVEYILGEVPWKKKSERFDNIDDNGKYTVAYED